MPLILVTGATGLTGTEVVRRLSARGAQVRALVRNAAGANAAKAADLSRLPGVEVVEGYVDVSPEDFRSARLAAGAPPYLVEGLVELFAERRKGKEATVWQTMENVFGRRPTSFDEFAGSHAAVFRGELPSPRV